jgi:hypothetical protein
VFLVLGGVLLIAAALPWRRQPGRVARRIRLKPGSLAVALGILAIPVAWYAVQLTNLTVANYPGTYWWPFQRNPGSLVDVVFALLIAGLASLVTIRPLRIAAVIAGAPMVVIGAAGLLAPAACLELIRSVGLPASWRYSELLDAVSGLPLLYGGILVTAGLTRRARTRPVAASARSRRSFLVLPRLRPRPAEQVR